MGIGKLIAKAASSLMNAGQKVQYGKQIGTMSKSGLLCFEKTGKHGESIYTTVNAATQKVVKTKTVRTQKGFMEGFTKDADGNVISRFSQSREAVGYGMESFNVHAAKVRNIYSRYNKMGQTTYTHDITYQPTKHAGSLEVQSCINGEYANYCTLA